MEPLLLGSLLFAIALICGFIFTPPIIRFLKYMHFYKVDRKKTLYGEEAKEFNKIREKEEKEGEKKPTRVPRLGGLSFFPTIFIVTFLAFFLPLPKPFIIILILLLSMSIFTLYDDLTDIGRTKRKSLSFIRRLIVLFFITLAGGVVLQSSLPTIITFLPFEPFIGVEVGLLFGLFFAMWYVFWHVSSIIDGIDGLSSSVYITLFMGTGILSIYQGNVEAYLLSSLAIGLLIPYLYFNSHPAKLYLTEVGITILTFLFASTTFLLAVGADGGSGIWLGFIFGVVLIGTWVSNVLQLAYRKKTGKKLLKIAPIHHHFEACGWNAKKVVSLYVSVTLLAVVIGLLLVAIIVQ